MFDRRVLLPAAVGAILVGVWGGKASEAGVSVWDTAKGSAKPLALTNLEEAKGWRRIAQGRTGVSFKGDAVMTNGRVLVVLRKRGGGAELYSVQPTGEITPLRLRLLALARRRDAAVSLRRVSLVENGKSAVRLEASFRSKRGKTVGVKFRLKRGQVFIETEPGTGTDGLRVECSGRFAVMPDFFADDMVLDAAELSLDQVEIPSDNFLLHMTADGASIAMCVFENREQDVKVRLSGRGEKRSITGSEIRYGKKGQKIWVALLDAPGIWHTVHVKPSDVGKTTRLDWRMPFPAMWRADFRRPNGLTDSWEMLLQDRAGGKYTKPRWFGGKVTVTQPSKRKNAEHTVYDDTIRVTLPENRKRWNTVLGNYFYPCWTDHQGQGYIQPFKKRRLSFDGPVIIYPVNRVEKTPFDKYTVVDVVRNTLGVGPCEYVLDLEGQEVRKKGRATCGVRNILRKIYKGGRQKQERAQVEDNLERVMLFIRHIRFRIELYVECGHELRKYFAQQKRAHPQFSQFLDKMDSIATEMDERYNARRERIKTPEYAQRLVDEFRRNVVERNPPDAYEKCKVFTAALVDIGGSQDELAGECRWVIRALRQQAGIAMAMDPRVAKIAKEIRARTQKALRNPALMETPRH